MAETIKAGTAPARQTRTASTAAAPRTAAPAAAPIVDQLPEEPDTVAFNPLNSISLDDWKKVHGVDKLTFVSSGPEKQKFATYGDDGSGRIFVGKNTDIKQPLFVMVGAYGAFWLVNAPSMNLEIAFEL